MFIAFGRKQIQTPVTVPSANSVSNQIIRWSTDKSLEIGQSSCM